MLEYSACLVPYYFFTALLVLHVLDLCVANSGKIMLCMCVWAHAVHACMTECERMRASERNKHLFTCVAALLALNNSSSPRCSSSPSWPSSRPSWSSCSSGTMAMLCSRFADAPRYTAASQASGFSTCSSSGSANAEPGDCHAVLLYSLCIEADSFLRCLSGISYNSVM